MDDDLLQALPGTGGTHGAGDDLSFSAEFDAIAEARRADDPTLPLGDWKERGKEPKSADWPAVAALCERVLRTRSKDLRVAGWLTDAWARNQGFAGLTAGLELQARMIERWWDQLHPLSDGDDHELRIGALSWTLKQVPSLARELAGTAAEHGATQDAANAALAALAKLQVAVDARLGADGPSFAQARESLQEALHGLPSGAVAPSAAGSMAKPTPAGTTTTAARATEGAGGPPTTRAQALQQLREVAEFFRRTEPHSPVAYLADKAARWGGTDLHLWLRQVVKDDGTLSRLEELLGVEPPRSNS